MRAIVYTETGDPDVLTLVERDVPEPGPGEVRVRVHVSGVNPTDWKARRAPKPAFPETVPNQDGSGVIDAVGPDLSPDRIGERVWIWEAARRRANGTAQEYVTVPAAHAVALPDHASFELGASLGIPALTAHRCLTTYELSDGRLGPGALSGMVVLVAGGAGAVGNAAIQLARWAGAAVISTVSGPDKADLARKAGADLVVNYRTGDAAEQIRGYASRGVDMVVELAPSANAALDHAVVAPAATIAVYATEGDHDAAALPIGRLMSANTRYQFVLVYTVPELAKAQAVADVSVAVGAGSIRVGEEAGLPLHRFPLAETAAAHQAVENSVVGKVLIDVA
jgi:NADPH2:quinone reductase